PYRSHSLAPSAECRVPSAENECRVTEDSSMAKAFRSAAIAAAAILTAQVAQPQSARAQIDSRVYGGLRWRHIGPHRGGRTKAAAGIPNQPNVFYVGVVNGGVWKTADYGRTWVPIFDDQPTGSIGAIAIAPSDPSIMYVGSGEGLQRPDLSTGD